MVFCSVVAGLHPFRHHHVHQVLLHRIGGRLVVGHHHELAPRVLVQSRPPRVHRALSMRVIKMFGMLAALRVAGGVIIVEHLRHLCSTHSCGSALNSPAFIALA